LVRTTKAYLDNLKQSTSGLFYSSLKNYLEARITELDQQWATSNGSMDDFRQLQGRKLEISEMLKQLTSKPVKVQPLDGYGN